MAGCRFLEGRGEGSWEGKNQRKSMKGSLFLSLRVGADKRDWALKSDRNVCTGYIFVKILSPPKKEARGGFQKGPGGGGRGREGQGEGLRKGHGGHRKRFGRARMATKACPGHGFVRFAARCLFSGARSRVRRGGQKVAKTIGKARF